MTDLYLIAHKVRGEPAFDVAVRMDCPLCNKIIGGVAVEDARLLVCAECDDLGYWWIIPTSGHRAYPYWYMPLNALEGDVGCGYFNGKLLEMPLGLPDHYPHSAEPTKPRIDLSALIPKSAPIRRRA